MLDVRRLRLLRELAHRGTIAAVADALTYTPSAVSQQLTALEREAGTPLLERTGRSVTLTPAALRLVEHTETILAVLEQAAAELASARTELTGTLRIGTFPTAVHTILSPALVTLSRDHPLLELLVTELDPAAAPAALRAETLDIALRQEYDYVPLAPEPGLDSEPLFEETVHLATLTQTVHTRAPTGRAPASAPEPLAAHAVSQWIAGTPGTLCHEMTVRACLAAGFTPRIRHHADDFGTVLALVAAGQGVALVPDLGAQTVPDAVALTPLPTRRRTRLAYRRGTGEHPVIAAARTALHTAAATPLP
ncbi:LysR substrate-binding domain-containing protein [Nocardia seriolae]|uniref:LysR substrate-binding domain-containing protein n=1 Tax=Nocardia seriolae TaxID=37332 RepID=UPI0008FF1EB8|nr:LysR substrate-binding domain-containing protein [Nocardia seriolae]OJF78437.1 LysR family transcriptional regulator [Nocardia seriolae]PSK31573.1 LysR family transcriptional regulator [Nocardia seriolae]QOW31334.1 LysR family transcriptional regulator [Nocardia seriolae]QUN18946.1 LysR family transcriptional regulator [Nocardia seriolae]WNJ58358.1 LysR substrate-binding domain-containing protein [Nocardia seriolae]